MSKKNRNTKPCAVKYQQAKQDAGGLFRFPDGTRIEAGYIAAEEQWWIEIRVAGVTYGGKHRSIHYGIRKLGQKWWREQKAKEVKSE